MDSIPDYAVVNTTVDLCKKHNLEFCLARTAHNVFVLQCMPKS